MRTRTGLAAPRLATFLAVLALALIAAFGIAGAAPKKPAANALGLPSQGSLLFSLNAKAGTMEPAGHGAGSDHYRLKLTGVDGRAVWFSDRPRRDAGRLATDRFFGGWGSLGFRADPPNAAIVAEVGRRTRTVAVELKLRRYDRRDRSADFDARVLGSLGGGLDHLNRSLGDAPVGEFKAPTLFVDNGGSEPDCTLGETRLLPISPASEAAVDGMVPAEGQILSIENYTPLFSVITNTYGGDGKTTFAVPKLASPPGTTYFLCAEGYFPEYETLSQVCNVGQTVFWALPNDTTTAQDWQPADGHKVLAYEFPEYAQRFGGSGEREVVLPTVTAPPGTVALTCLATAQGFEPPTIIGELDLLPSLSKSQEGSLLPATGQAVSSSSPLGALLAEDSVLGGKVPNLPAAGPLASWFISNVGTWPLG